ncbi:uncharacterized protein CLUP02_15875 [Colletotrichum lupini]|uniref:Uncharacterized protein n=1 Tax=Colletotrichum lupini TaxID=145971 RepID=A0A9Q8T7D4_9PEZI|nr:uncharacterized protein CLUP02_15875 [Colletotrichum lupini]UQC90345.1 hypothetical protein CLUP02_15875 [Colletotrichum lupini]
MLWSGSSLAQGTVFRKRKSSNHGSHQQNCLTNHHVYLMWYNNVSGMFSSFPGNQRPVNNIWLLFSSAMLAWPDELETLSGYWDNYPSRALEMLHCGLFLSALALRQIMLMAASNQYARLGTRSGQTDWIHIQAKGSRKLYAPFVKVANPKAEGSGPFMRFHTQHQAANNVRRPSLLHSRPTIRVTDLKNTPGFHAELQPHRDLTDVVRVSENTHLVRQLVGVYSVCPRWLSYHFAIQLKRDVTDHLALTHDLPDPWTLTDQGSLKVGLAIAEIPTVWFSHACDIVVLEQPKPHISAPFFNNLELAASCVISDKRVTTNSSTWTCDTGTKL